MGQSESPKKKINNNNLLNISLEKNQLIVALTNLLRVSPIQKISQHEAKVGNEQEGQSLTFQIKTSQPIIRPQNINGYIEIIAIKTGIKIFQGEMKNGQRDGFGVEYDSNGNLMYEGDFKDNLYNGWGVTSRYKGEFLNGERHGWGKYENPETLVKYEGGWKNDQFNGIGCLNIGYDEIDNFFKDTLNIEYLQSKKIHYIGQWKDGLMHGCGKLIKRDEIYAGEFQNDQYNGLGNLYRQNKKQKGNSQREKKQKGDQICLMNIDQQI